MLKVQIFNVTKNEKRPLPYRLKWRVGDRDKSKSFKRKGEGDAFKRKLERALEDGLSFSPSTGLPELWGKTLKTFAEVAREHAASKWHEWSPTSRVSHTESIATVIYELLRPYGASKYERPCVLRVIRNLLINQNKLEGAAHEKEVLQYVLSNSCKMNEISIEKVSEVLKKIDINSLNGEPASKDLFRKRKQTFGTVMDYAYRHKYINDNTFKRVKTKKIETLEALDPIVALNPADCRNYCQVLRNWAKVKKGYFMESADFLEIVWLAGLRPSEVAGLKVKNVNLFLDQRTSYLKVECAVVSLLSGYADNQATQVSKGLKARGNKAFRNVPILAELRPTIERLVEDKDPEDFLFTDPKTGTKPVKTDLVNRYFKKVCLTSHTTYDLRHTNASILIYSGLNIVEVANRLGNSVDVCQKVYLHMLNKVEDINLSREDEFLKNAVKPLKFETYEIGTNFWEPPIPKN